MIFEPDTVKGFEDFLPPESLKREKVIEIIKKYYKLYGFLPIETPIVEYDELMRSEILPSEQEDEAISDRFKLKDKGGRNLGLRYEFTFQLARIFKQNSNLKLPFKRYQIGPVFRDEPISLNRFRQFTQCDTDVIGSSEITTEIELLSMVSDILKELKIEKIEIQINNRKLIQAIIESVEIPQITSVMKELDKIEKIGEDQVKVNLKKYTSSNQVITLFKLLEKPIEFFKENSFDGIDELFELFELAEKYKIKLKYNPFLVRGLGYYTGNIFEIKEIGKSSIAGGGRYDRIVGKYVNREIPAVGISFGLERVCQLANIKIESYQKVLIISLADNSPAIKLASQLRNSGISCSLSYGKPGKQLEYANSLSIPYVIFIGEEEVKTKKFKLKDMSSGKETILTDKQIISKLNKSN